MTKRDDLFAAILANPDDDSLRLVYADQIEEEGDPARAMLIHRQVELARLPRWDRRVYAGEESCAALLAQHGARWRAELPRLKGITWTEFERGFCSTVRAANVAALYKQAAAIARAAPVFRAELRELEEADHPYRARSVPWMRVLRLVPQPYGYEVRARDSILSATAELELALVQSAQLDWIENREATVPLTRLSLSGDHTAGLAFIRHVIGAPWAKRLETLELGTGFIDNDTGYFEDPTMRGPGATAMIDAGLARMRRLDLEGQRVGSDGIGAIVATMPILAELVVRHCEITDIGPLVAQDRGPPIVQLDLSDNTIGDAGVARLADSTRFAGLESLQLSLCELGAPGLRALTAAPFWPTLQRLDVSRNAFGVDGMVALIDAAPPAKLHRLNLADDDLSGEMLARVAVLPWFAALDTLDLGKNALGDGSGLLAALAAGQARTLGLTGTGLSDLAPLAPAWARLVELDLSANPIGATGLGGLITDEESALVWLDLTRCKLTPEAIAILARARCPNLRMLRLARNTINTAMFDALLHAPLMAGVEELVVSHCGLKTDVIGVLANAPELPALQSLRMNGIKFTPKQLHALAEIPRFPNLEEWKLDGDAWSMSDTSRTKLTARFGQSWWWTRETDAEQGDPGEDDEA